MKLRRLLLLSAALCSAIFWCVPSVAETDTGDIVFDCYAMVFGAPRRTCPADACESPCPRVAFTH
jgi:hypothetical protein